MEVAKALRIRSGVVKRLRKELAAYTSECEREQEKLEKMRADGADKHDIKQQVWEWLAVYILRAGL